MREHNTYTGILNYKDIDFNFIFDKKELKMVPPQDKQRDVYFWFMKPLGNGAYTFGDPIYIEGFLYGISNETGQKIIFFPSKENIRNVGATLIVNIECYIINKYEREKIDRIAIKGPEIDCIYPTTTALNKIDWGKDGEIVISTKPFKETTSGKEKFDVDGKECLIYFGISISGSYQTGKSPISLRSTLFIEFEPTDCYEFIINLLNIAKEFVQFLCYRRNIVFSSIDLSAPVDKGLHETFATLYRTQDEDVIETYPLEKGRLIKYEYLKGNVGKIINDISCHNIYTEHIPETYKLGRRINAGKFVMITAAFEWEFKRNYPSGIKKDIKTQKSEETVTIYIDKLIKKSTGKVKKILKFLRKLIKSDNLESKIIEYGKDYGEISDAFGTHLYSLNGEVLDYKKMGKRLSDQRNHFAHGDIDKEFIGSSLLDLVYLEYIIYIIQLKYYGVDDKMIKQAINDLFGCRLAI